MTESRGDTTEGVGLLYRERPEFAPFFEFLLAKKRSPSEITADQLLGSCDLGGLVPPQRRRLVVEFLKYLESLKAGTLIIGRRGKKTRFVFRRSLQEISSAAKGGLRPSASPGEERVAATAVPQATYSLFQHRFPVRSDFTLEFALPVDLTTEEAERLSAFVRALPLSRG